MPMVDYNQFKKENIGMFLKEWMDVVKEIDPLKRVMADNISSMTAEDWSYERPQDDWIVGDNCDQIGMSLYPKHWPKEMEPHTRCQVMTGIHSASKDGRYWVSELQTHTRSMYDSFSAVKPENINFWTWEAISRGAKGIIYWKWEPFIKGVQTFGRGLVDTTGKYTDRAYQAQKIANIIHENDKEFYEYMPIQPKVAILYDSLNLDFIKTFTKDYEPKYSSSIYTDAVKGLHKCLFDLNIPAEFIRANDKLKIAALEGEEGYILFAFNYGTEMVKSKINIFNIAETKVVIKDISENIQTECLTHSGTLEIDTQVNERDVKIYIIKR
jgi:beta-galactosidase GanA